MLRSCLLLAVLCVSVFQGSSPSVATASDAQLDFFEKKIRPVLAEHCYPCHAAQSESIKGGLRLDSARATKQGGESGPAVVPGQPENSLLLSALKYDTFEMPPAGKLPGHVIADFEKWIRDGAADPRNTPASPVSEPAAIDFSAGRKFWAFQPPKLSSSMDESVRDSSRIDRLIDRQLEQRGLVANLPTDRRTLLRRLTFDITGLPPTAEDVAAFVADDRADAVTSAVDRLLAAPTYGQRWARLWLDVSRFAEDQAHIVGNNKSLFYPNAHRYRDWVIEALNDDMPYDEFLRWQLAADLIEPDSDRHTAALGFIGLGPKYYRRGDPEVMAEEWEDRVDVVSRGLLGLTVACARCHDHKYDPIETEDYYALAGVFASTEMFNKPLAAKPKPVNSSSKSTAEKKKNAKQPQETLHVIRDSKKPRDLKVMIRGKVNQTGAVVPRGFLRVLFAEPRRQFTNGSGRRELAEAITDRNNPLTARVIVNRVWKEFFGRGLVNTPSNFGRLGDRPTHPELLDDLTVRFMDHGWSLKWLQRQIVLSRAYQRSSALAESAAAVDSANTLLWRMPRRRLSVEAWRDAVLTTAGTIDTHLGGPSIRPDNPQELRRTVYAAVSRFELNPMLARFDFPDPNVHAAARAQTDTPLQKLFLLNNPFMLHHAKSLASRVQNAATDPDAQVDMLFQLAWQRPAESDERTAIVRLIADSETGLQQVAQSIFAANEFWYLD